MFVWFSNKVGTSCIWLKCLKWLLPDDSLKTSLLIHSRFFIFHHRMFHYTNVYLVQQVRTIYICTIAKSILWRWWLLNCTVCSISIPSSKYKNYFTFLFQLVKASKYFGNHLANTTVSNCIQQVCWNTSYSSGSFFRN